jgi:hypothetical protein
MKFLIHISVLYVLFQLFPLAEARAQDTQTERRMQVTARAVIMDNLMLYTMRDLDLMNPTTEGSRLFVSPLESPFSGQFRINGSALTSVRVTYLIYEDIQEASGNGGIVNARYLLSGLPRDNQFQSMLFAPTGEFNIQLGGDGQYFLWIGADLDLSRALPGEYFSEFIIEMEYT